MTKAIQGNFTTLVCDTDFLIKISNSPAPAFHEFMSEVGLILGTIPLVVSELKGLSKSSHALTAKHAKNCLSLIGRNVELLRDDIEDAGKDADNALIEFGKNHRGMALVCTLDGNLLSRLERLKISYLTLRKDKPVVHSLSRAIYLSARKE